MSSSQLDQSDSESNKPFIAQFPPAMQGGSQTYHYEDGLFSAIPFAHCLPGEQIPQIPMRFGHNQDMEDQFKHFQEHKRLFFEHLQKIYNLQQHQKGCKITCTCGLWQQDGYPHHDQNSQSSKMHGKRPRPSNRKDSPQNEESYNKKSQKSGNCGSEQSCTVNYNYQPHFSFTAQNYVSGMFPGGIDSHSHHLPFSGQGFTGLFGFGGVNFPMPNPPFPYGHMGQFPFDHSRRYEGEKESPNRTFSFPDPKFQQQKPSKASQPKPSIPEKAVKSLQKYVGSKRKLQNKQKEAESSKKSIKRESSIKVNQFD